MAKYSPLRAVLFIYESIRFCVLLGIFLALAPDSPLIPFPWPVFIVPNALFPLMTLFLWLRPASYRPYAALYAAGKIVAAAALLGWCVLSRPDLAVMVLADRRSLLFALGAVVFLFAGDALSAAGALALVKGRKEDN
ncbi:MAG: hypothetical protein LBQ55_07170 [Treponema sp.]|jgi:hypothetical protein|nr:hypothetical protein [Treponema sp.]